MTAYILFNNNNDVSVNKYIANKTGEKNAFDAAMLLFKIKRVPRHQHVIIRKDTTRPTQPRVYTNLFLDTPNLNGIPWIFDRF